MADVGQLTAEVVRLTAERDDWQKAGASVGVNCPGAMQQAKRMAVAACSALGLCYVETAPSDIREAVARLTEALAESEADKVSLYQEARGLRERLDAAEQKLAAAENQLTAFGESTMRLLERAESAEQKLAEEKALTDRWYKRTHDAEQRLETAEAALLNNVERGNGYREALETAEARCAEMTETAQAAGQRTRDAASALADAESELVQLLERVGHAERIAKALGWTQVLEALRGQRRAL